MNKTTKPKIEDIYPLSDLQKGLLMHHLYQKVDQGRIRTQCILKGYLKVDLFKQAWAMTVARHQSLRSSIHWEKIEKPIQVVRPAAQIEWLSTPSEEKLPLDQAPQGRWSLEKLDAQTHKFCWDSHHILLDGWSSGIILGDVFAYYDALTKGETFVLDTIPTYRSYLNWRKNQDDVIAETYWSDRLSQVEPLLLPEEKMTSAVEYVDRTFQIGAEDLDRLKKYAQSTKVTLNTIIQICWATILSRLTDREGVVFGTTVSGRPAEIPNLDQLAGLFSQLLPVYVPCPDKGFGLIDFLKHAQLMLQRDQVHGYLGSEQILQAAKTSAGKLFNSLLIVQNYPWQTLEGGGVRVSDYQGDMTTTFPLTVTAIPGEELSIHIRYQAGAMAVESIDWIGESICLLLIELPNLGDASYQQFRQLIDEPKFSYLEALSLVKGIKEEEYTIPNSPTELELVKMWEALLDYSPISPLDDFFELGGTSLLAVRLFAKIRNKFDKNLPPITLLEHRNIRRIARIINEEEGVKWETVVPLKASGSKTPVFCFHAGRGHVFFYHPLATALKDRPVFAIQPKHLDGTTEAEETIESMALAYLFEIQKVQENGPYIFLAYCYSTAIVMELARILIERGDQAPKILIVDSGPTKAELDKAINYSTRPKPIRWYLSSLRKGKVNRAIDEALKHLAPRFLLSERQIFEMDRQKIRDQILPAYNRYIWPLLDIEIALFISRARTSDHSAMERLENWELLAKKGVEKYIVDGKHRELFESGTVEYLSEAIDNYIARSEKEYELLDHHG
ncbi:MAG: condensation domain-containing protein [Bacteroidota bacterium]